MASVKPFDGRVIVITGAAQGMGLAYARYLAARGASLSLADVKGPELETAAETIRKESPGVTITTAVVDVRKPHAVDEWISSTIETLGKLHGAVNNAGVARKRTLAKEIDDEHWDSVIAVNLTGVMNCTRAELKVIENGGSIVNIASIVGLIGAPGYSAYAASKHGVVGYTRSVAKEVAEQQVRVNAVCPGVVDTPMATDWTKEDPHAVLPAALKRYGKPEEIAAMVGYLLGPESTYITGMAYAVDGGWVC